MISITLSHKFTPSELVVINDKICALLSEDELDEKQLAELTSQREDIVKTHLEKLTASDLKLFAEAELQVNQKLIDLTQQRRSDMLKQLSGFLRGRKSVKKYK